LIPIKGFDHIFNVLDTQHFIAVEKYFYPICYSLVNKSLIQKALNDKSIRIKNLFAIPDSKEFSIDSYYKYNYDLKSLTRHYKNTCQEQTFNDYLKSHYIDTRKTEKYRINCSIKQSGNSHYLYSAGTMFWFDKKYLNKFIKYSNSFDSMIKEMRSEKRAVINNKPTYTHFLENWFGIVACHKEKKLKTLKSVTFLMPYLQDDKAYSGGFRNLILHINHLINHGYFINLQFCLNSSKTKLQDQLNYISAYNIIKRPEKLCLFTEEKNIVSDVYIATGWQSFKKAKLYENNGQNVGFFCQDLEFEFDAVKKSRDRNLFKSVKSFYHESRPTFTISRYLGIKLKKFHNGDIISNQMYVESKIYKISNLSKNRKGICMLYSSSKSHRLPDLTLQLIKLITLNFPNEPVYVFGDISTTDRILFPSTVKLLGSLSTRDLSKLYNRCKIGTCFSTTNPSRIGFEMSACGCPCVEIDCEYTKFDLSDELFAKCEPNLNKLFATIKTLLTEKDILKTKFNHCVEFSASTKFQKSEPEVFTKMLEEKFYK